MSGENKATDISENDIDSNVPVISDQQIRVKKGLKEPDARPHLNVVFIGHVDAGKSTTCGYILCQTGMVDARTLEKYEREAKENNRESWYYAYVMDINEEERSRGKTVEVGRATFELEQRRYTILDAPGHKGFVPEMLSGASQADVGVLIISARKGEFEAGFERGGQTQEHALLAKTLGVNTLIVAVNKMDEPTVCWDKERYDTIVAKLSVFLKACGFHPTRDVSFLPMSALSGQNVAQHVSDSKSDVYDPRASWYPPSQPTLFQILENCIPPKRDENASLRIPLLSTYKDSGLVCVGKVEAGTVQIDQQALVMPGKLKVKIVGIRNNEEDYSCAKPGENVELRITGCEEESIRKGSVICSILNPVPVATVIEVQMIIVEMLEHRPLITLGYSAVFHAHTMCEECEIVKLIETTEKSTKKRNKKPAFIKAGMSVICQLKLSQANCLEAFHVVPTLGRFTLRDEGRTIAVGKILSIVDQV